MKALTDTAFTISLCNTGKWRLILRAFKRLFSVRTLQKDGILSIQVHACLIKSIPLMYKIIYSHPFLHSFIHSFIPSFIHSFIRLFIFIYLFIRLLIYLFKYLFISLFISSFGSCLSTISIHGLTNKQLL